MVLQCSVDIDFWQCFLQKTYPQPKHVLASYILKRSIPMLVDAITLDEITKCLSNCKNGKAPVTDGVDYSFFKNLPQNWLMYINHLFNKILTQEKVPNEWGNLSTFMLFKKGDSTDPDNYRPITLVNCLAKIFTQILSELLISWAEGLNLIPESQVGFRKGRSCVDNLFNLMSILQIHLNNPGAVVYAAFIDFKGAFPSISHQLL